MGGLNMSYRHLLVGKKTGYNIPYVRLGLRSIIHLQGGASLPQRP